MFATAPSPSGPWAVLDINRYSMPINVEHADPTLRFIPDTAADTKPASELGGWFYVMTGRVQPLHAVLGQCGQIFHGDLPLA